MPQTINDRLHQLTLQHQEAGRSDSAADLHGPGATPGGAGAAKARAKSEAPRVAARQPDSPRDLYGDATGKVDASEKGASAPAPTAAALKAPVTVRRKLEGARQFAQRLHGDLEVKLHTAQSFAQHATGAIDERLEGTRAGGAKGPAAVALNLREQIRAPVEHYRQHVEKSASNLAHLDGLLGLHDHELDDLRATRHDLPQRLATLEHELDYHQEVLVWHNVGRPDPSSFFRDPAVAERASHDSRSADQVKRDVFAGRQEFLRLNRALEGIDGASKLITP